MLVKENSNIYVFDSEAIFKYSISCKDFDENLYNQIQNDMGETHVDRSVNNLRINFNDENNLEVQMVRKEVKDSSKIKNFLTSQNA